MALLEETASVDCHLKDKATSHIYLSLDFLEGFLASSLVGAMIGMEGGVGSHWEVLYKGTNRPSYAKRVLRI
jgi:hypothetical protein